VARLLPEDSTTGTGLQVDTQLPGGGPLRIRR